MKNIFASSTQGAQAFMMISIVGSIIALCIYGMNWSIAGLMLLGYFMYGCLGIVVTYHRKLTHNSYQTYPLLTKLFSILGCFAGTGSPMAWVAIHINHHIKSDKAGDPHSPYTKGWKIFLLNYEHEVNADTKWRMRSMVVDKFHQVLHRYYFLIIAAWSLILFLLGGFYLMVFLHWAPAAITGLMSNVVNYIGHKPSWVGGFRTYNLSDNSTNNWLWALPSWGETWHNNHHRHPRNFTSSEKWWQVDISGALIKLIKQ